MNCHLNDAEPDLPDTGGSCCWGVVVYGPQRCTCWEPVYDLEQASPDPEAARWLAAGIEPSTRRRMCGDCAYRPGSPERSGDETYAGDPEFLEHIAGAGERFWCHQGMRRPVLWRHPSGIEIPGHPGAYRPPKVGGVPYKADGTPGDLCAGWAARGRALAGQCANPGNNISASALPASAGTP